MAAITATLINPVSIHGSERLDVWDVTMNIANNDTHSIKNMTFVKAAWLEPDASGQTHGIALSGTGNTTLTFKVSGALKGKLFVLGQ